MAEKETKNTESTNPENVEIEPLSDKEIEDVAGGASSPNLADAMCSMAACS